MKNLKLIAGFLAIGIILTGCSRHPKVDFSVPTESNDTSETTTMTEAVTTTVSEEEAQPGFAKADDAYQAYLDASEAQDVDAFCALFNADEIVNAKDLPSKFLKNRFQLRLDSDYTNFAARTNPDAFRKMVMANFNSFTSAMEAFGTGGEQWKIIPGERKTMESSEVQSFANSLHLNITRGFIYDTFYFEGQESGAQVEGESVYLLCIDGRWYPSYTKECVPLSISLTDIDPEYASEIGLDGGDTKPTKESEE